MVSSNPIGFLILLSLATVISQTKAVAQSFRQSSVLAAGTFYKLAVDQDGLYRIDYDFLKKNGIAPEQINPQHIRLWGNRSGMLPQANSAPTADDLVEMSVYVFGEEDGRFDAGDYVLFYAQGPDRHYYEAAAGQFVVEKNLYDDQNYYFLETGSSPGKRVISRASLSYSYGKPVETFSEVIHHEEDLHSIVQSGRYWYGEAFSEEESTLSLPFTLPGVVAGSEIKVTASVVSKATQTSRFAFSLNQATVGTITVEAAQAGVYGYKARVAQQQFTLTAPTVENIALQIRYETASALTGYLDYVTVQVERKLALYDSLTHFYGDPEVRAYSAEYRVDQMDSLAVIWDVTDPQQVRQQAFNLRQQQAIFKAPADTLREFIVFRPQHPFPVPQFVQRVAPQNLHALQTPELLMITTETFTAAAQRLAQFRTGHDGLSSAVVTTAQIYHEFSAGRQDVTAIRNFIRMLYVRHPRLKYVLLLGDASYDYKQREKDNTNFVPTYQSYNSLHNVHSYASDDYYGFLEADEGIWPESGNETNTHDLDIGIGRIPVSSAEEAEAVVEKLIRYESDAALGDWRKNMIFVADDGDNNKHQLQSDRLATFVETQYPDFDVNRVFLDAYPQDKGSSAVREIINRQISKGVMVLDFIGHGGETAWTNENILDTAMINAWRNTDRLPLLLTATCEFGRYDDPKRRSGAELALLHPGGGAVGLLTTTRPVFTSTNFSLSTSFYETAFAPIHGHMPRLGDVFRLTKNKSLAGTANRNFSLLGDPSMRLSIPQQKVWLETINGNPATGADTLCPLQTVTLTGFVAGQEQVDDTFNGRVHITCFGQPTEVTTLGDEGAETVMTFQNREQRLFKGTASVSNGKFTTTFIIPKNVAATWKKAKISFYAIEETTHQDATGSYADLWLGGTPTAETTDRTPPDICLYLNDERFTPDSPVYPQATLLAQLSDENGINITGKEQGIVAHIDRKPSQTYVLNDWYEAAQDDYRQGTIAFPLPVLEPGLHTLWMQAADVYGNVSEKEISFTVVSDSVPLIRNLTLYPNPSEGEVHFSFFYSQPGSVLVSLEVYNDQGQQVATHEAPCQADESGYVTLDWHGAHLRNGMYLYRLMAVPDDGFPRIVGTGKLILGK